MSVWATLYNSLVTNFNLHLSRGNQIIVLITDGQTWWNWYTHNNCLWEIIHIDKKKKSRNKCLQMTITFLELNNQFENTRSADLYIVYNIFTQLSKMWFKITAFEKICLQNASMDGRSENNRTSPPPTHTHFVYRGITIVYESTCPKI